MPIDSVIRKIIKAAGHITIDDMMAEIMTNNSSAYYQNVEEIGAEGDFITAPEISQLFGEIIGLWVIEKWQQIGCPSKLTLLELGPGRGTLMKDLLRSVSLKPELASSLEVVMHDVNPKFIKKQKEQLASYENIKWQTNLADLPKQPLIVISNEFFDALPIKQYRKYKKTWYESTMVVDPVDGRIKYSKLGINKNLQSHFNQEHPDATDGAIIEESVTGFAIIKRLAKQIKKHSGAFLAIDYGYNIEMPQRQATQYNATLQAIKDHEYQSIIDTLGEADLSSHVDFVALKKAAARSGIKDARICTQEEFLKKYGIMIRLQQLQQQNKGEVADRLGKQVWRLTSAEQMGELFKVIEFVSAP
jgi:SAM-dependent MidA family methyltransferase